MVSVNLPLWNIYSANLLHNLSFQERVAASFSIGFEAPVFQTLHNATPSISTAQINRLVIALESSHSKFHVSDLAYPGS